MARASQLQQKEYRRLVKAKTPAQPLLRNFAFAFLVGGAITTVGQGVLKFFVRHGMAPVTAASPTAAVMIFVGALFTGLGLYDSLSKVGGMGAALPITGFANSIVAPAMEFKREGYVMGVGARMFTIAGPVIVFGVVTALAVALVLFAFGKI